MGQTGNRKHGYIQILHSYFAMNSCLLKIGYKLTLLHSEKPKLCTILAFLSAVGLNSPA